VTKVPTLRGNHEGPSEDNHGVVLPTEFSATPETVCTKVLGHAVENMDSAFVKARLHLFV